MRIHICIPAARARMQPTYCARQYLLGLPCLCPCFSPCSCPCLRIVHVPIPMYAAPPRWSHVRHLMPKWQPDRVAIANRFPIGAHRPILQVLGMSPCLLSVDDVFYAAARLGQGYRQGPQNRQPTPLIPPSGRQRVVAPPNGLACGVLSCDPLPWRAN
jgi:hypothetical protein